MRQLKPFQYYGFTDGSSTGVNINLEDRNKRDADSQPYPVEPQADAPYTDDKIGYHYQFTYRLDQPRKKYTWPTPSGITQEEARQICEETRSVIEKYPSCANTVERINIQECIEDIKVRRGSK